MRDAARQRAHEQSSWGGHGRNRRPGFTLNISALLVISINGVDGGATGREGGPRLPAFGGLLR